VAGAYPLWGSTPELMIGRSAADRGPAEADTAGDMPRVDYVIQYAESLERSVAFYRDVIGLKVRREGGGYVEFDMGNTKFALFERAKLPELIGREGGNPPCGEIGFLIDDVDGEAERLRRLGVIEFAQKLP
jgi:lactoylglutathione lyase